MIAAASWSDWVWWGSGWGLVALGVAMAVWALLWDRARGRVRCPRCWYDMRGGGLVCPECGRVVKSERALRRTRRRWGWAVAGVVIVLVGAQMWDQPGRRREGWTRAVPTSVLVFLARPADPRQMGRLWGVNAAIVNRDVRGWRGAVAEWRTCRLDETTASEAVRTRRKWPMGVPVEIRAHPSLSLYPQIGWLTMRAWPSADPSKVATLTLEPPHDWGTYMRGSEPPPKSFVLTERGVGAHVETVTVSMHAQGWEVARRETSVAYEVVATLDEAVMPLASEELTARVRAALGLMNMPNAEEDLIAYELWWRDRVEPFGWCGLQVEVIVGDEIVLTVTDDSYFSIATVAAAARMPDSRVVIADGPDVKAFARTKVRLRVRGDQRRTLMRNFDAEAYWAGEVEVGLAELLDQK